MLAWAWAPTAARPSVTPWAVAQVFALYWGRNAVTQGMKAEQGLAVHGYRGRRARVLLALYSSAKTLSGFWGSNKIRTR